MKKLIVASFGIALAVLLTAGVASAKCYHFSNADSDVAACVHGDSFSDRKKAREICSKGEGKDCGNVTSSSSSCHSNSNRCYDENGNKKRDLSGY